MRASFWPIYASYGSLCKRPRNLLPQRPETSSTTAFPLSNKSMDGLRPPSLSLLVDHFGNNSSNPSAAPLGLMLAHCLPWVWFCAPRHLERPPRHRRLWPSRTSLPRPDRSGFIALRTLRSWEGPRRWRPPEGLPISKLDYLFPIIFQSIQLESSSPTDRWLYIARKNIFVINFWMFKS